TARPPASRISSATTTCPMTTERRSRALTRAGAVLEVDLAAIVENWRRLAARLAPGASCAAVVKADAYGLGMARVAPRLAAAGCRLFFVATIDEGIALRRVLPGIEIAVLGGFLPGTGGEFTRTRLIPVLNSADEIDAWRANPAMIHVDTGMARLGLARDELAALAGAPERLAGLQLRAVLSHLACAEDAGA